MRKLAGRLTIDFLSGGLTATAIAMAVFLSVIWSYGSDLPGHRRLANYEPPVVSRVYAADGKLIGEFASKKRVFVRYSAVPPRLVHAFVAAEDRHFFSHHGVDVGATIRAVYGYVMRGTGGRGGSTITQQVVKNILLTPERTLDRKIKEMLLAFRVERAYTKEKILELYLNRIYLGRQAYGVAAAAEVYFNKPLEKLTIAEAALLAALPKAPSRFDPENGYEAALGRRNYVIRRMAEDGYITADEADAARLSKIATVAPPPRSEDGREYFVEEIRRDLLEAHGATKLKAGGFIVHSTMDTRLQALATQALRRGLVAYDRRHGWRGPVSSFKEGKGKHWADNWRRKLRSLTPPAGHGDWPLAMVLEVRDGSADIGLSDGSRGRIPLGELRWARQHGAMKVEAGRPAYKSASGPPIGKAGDVLRQGDVILVERVALDGLNKAYPANTYTLRQVPEVNGGLVAMDPDTGRVLAMSGGFSFWLSQYNSTTQAWRQPGSSFKTYVYLAALREGFTPSTLILDAPIAVKDGDKIYKPQNFSGKFHGLTTLRTGFEKSYNLTTLRLAEATGLEKIAKLAIKLGVSKKIEPVMSMVLGSIETTAMRQVTAYSIIANGGKRIAPTLVDRIEDRHGRTIYRHGAWKCEECRVLTLAGVTQPRPPEKREQLVDADNAYLTVTLLLGVIRRGTGTSVRGLGRPIAGKTGTTNDMLDAWFVGFSPGLAVAVWVGFDRPRSLGPGEQGAVAAAPIFRDFMGAALKGLPVREFTMPAGVVVIRTGDMVEYYKAGTEPGTGKGRQLDTVTPDPVEPEKPKITSQATGAPDKGCYRYSPNDPYPRGRPLCR